MGLFSHEECIGSSTNLRQELHFNWVGCAHTLQSFTVLICSPQLRQESSLIVEIH